MPKTKPVMQTSLERIKEPVSFMDAR
jgi:hypothetical protein